MKEMSRGIPISFDVFDKEELRKTKKRESSRKWKKDNPEKARESNKKSHKKYYENNKEEILQQRNQYYQDNKEEILEQKKHYYQENKEEILERNKQHHQDNKEHRQKYQKEYRKQYNQRPEIIEKNKNSKNEFRKWLGVRAEYLKGKKYVCNSCLAKIKHEDLEVDHVLCKALHPELEFIKSNFQILCKKCHRIKTNMDLDLISRIRSETALVNLKI